MITSAAAFFQPLTVSTFTPCQSCVRLGALFGGAIVAHKAILMGSVSAVALAAVAGAAHAQDAATPQGFTVSLEGGALMGPNAFAEDKLGGNELFSGGVPFSGFTGSSSSSDIVDINDNVGFRAAIALGRQIDPLWDLRVAMALNHQLETSSTEEYSLLFSGFSGGITPASGNFSGLVTMRNDFDFETMDFEVGYTPEVDSGVNVRLFGGLRGIHYQDSQDKIGDISASVSGGGSISGGSGSITYGIDTEFFGVGPRVGIGLSSRIGDSMFGISGELAGAAMYGISRSTATVVVTDFSSGPGDTNQTQSAEEWGMVYDIEASLGLDLYISDATTLTLGVRAQQVNTMQIGSGGGMFSLSEDASRLSYGPTLKLVSQF